MPKRTKRGNRAKEGTTAPTPPSPPTPTAQRGPTVSQTLGGLLRIAGAAFNASLDIVDATLAATEKGITQTLAAVDESGL